MGNTLFKLGYTAISNLENSRQWNRMLQSINTESDYLRMVECMFSDDIFTENRIKTLKCFTQDLCQYHDNNIFWDHFCYLEDDLKKKVKISKNIQLKD